MMGALELLMVAIVAVGAGAVNALAGGGTLLTFPMLVAVGVPPVTANVTNTVALCPGYFGATLAQWNDLQTQSRRLWLLLPASGLGGIIGGVLLLNTGERLFQVLVPYLILLAVALLAIQESVRIWLKRHLEQSGRRMASDFWATLPIGLASVYGGYFGAGLSVIILAALGLTQDDTLTRLNAVKQAVALSVNVAAASLFLFSGQVLWLAALAMAIGALVGGALGGRLAGRLSPKTLRRVVSIIGSVVAVLYFLR